MLNLLIVELVIELILVFGLFVMWIYLFYGRFWMILYIVGFGLIYIVIVFL